MRDLYVADIRGHGSIVSAADSMCYIFFCIGFFAPISAKCVASIMPMTHVPEIGAENRYQTSSSAVAKKPRDASCLSVVSFNSTKRRLESFIVSYVGYRFIIAYS